MGIRHRGRVVGVLAISVGLVWAGTSGAHAQGLIAAGSPADDEARLRWWREARFGLFIHWGPVSLKGTEIGWSRAGERRGRKGTGTVPVEEYDNLYKQFNPTRFDADEWVRIAKDAGMRYLVFTTKHHDGFVNFDSALTDYKITSTASPYRRDLVAQLAEACHRENLRLGFYYSQPDWHHSDYRTDSHARYLEYLHGQVRELCENYGRVDVLWFDGLGGTAEDWDAVNLFKIIRAYQPHIIINNRCGLPGDHDTPEQRIGAFQRERPWETCMTIGTQWAWKPDDAVKTTKECVQTLVRVAGGDGNLLLNAGPMPDGRIEAEQVQRLHEIGQWLRLYGESIYATRGGPFKWNLPGPARLASTHKGNRIYVHVLDRREETLLLPPIDRHVIRSSTLTGGDVRVAQDAAGITLTVAAPCRNENDTIIILEMDGAVSEIAPVGFSSGSLAFGRMARASNTFHENAKWGPDKAFDDDLGTRWATDAGTTSARLEVDLGNVCTIGRATLAEACGKRVRKFELQYEVDSEWKTFYTGTEIGDVLSCAFKPVEARYVRLNILEATDGPTLWEFHLAGPESE